MEATKGVSNQVVATGKRKKSDSSNDEEDAVAAASQNNLNLFATLSDEIWNMISSFAAPPDVYNLALSSIHFFHEVVSCSDIKQPSSLSSNKTVRRSRRLAEAKAASAEAENDEKKVLATQLLRTSLLSSLEQVLEKSETRITLDALFKMGELPEGSALIAGSTMVAACLGKDWSNARWPNSPGDIDVYCSAVAAPQVRSWLVEEANQMFVGVNDGYIDMVDNRLSYAVDTKIHHVEAWGSFEATFEYKHEYDADASKEEYRQQTTEWGKRAQGYASWIWNNTMSFSLLGLDANDRVYDIKPKQGGTLPFDFGGFGKVDLIVATTGLSASDLLEGFDLDICKASFDGKKFHIPDPHLTFAGKTNMEPNRRAVVGSYVRHHHSEGRLEPIDFSRLASATIRAVRTDVPRTPFYGRLDIADRLPDQYNPNDRWNDSTEQMLHHPIVKLKYGAPIQFHNWCCKLVKRLRKYQKRGIEVVDAPTIPEEFSDNEYSIAF